MMLRTHEPATPPATGADYCPRCGAAYEPYQEYCLECGERLPVNRGVVGVLAAGWQRRLTWYPGDWIWPALLFGLLAALAAALAIVYGGRSTSTAAIPATQNTVTLGPGTSSAPVPTVATATAKLPAPPEPRTVGTGTLPTPPGPPAPPTSGGVLTWPAGTSGYTVVLESIPTGSPRAVAERRARGARTNGLPKVGVLVSANFSSLHPGYYVVFSGVYRTAGAATAALGFAHAHGFPDAYQVRVTR
jgi:hypothetical protein